jgi:GNAT superfamily N-acetyltransferase
MTQLLVRHATTADLDAIGTISLATGQPAIDSGADLRYARLLLEYGTVVVATQENQHVVGWGATWLTPLGELLSDLFVDPGRHGQGIGAGLLRFLWPARSEQADTPDRPRRFTFSSRHPAALPLYARAGLASTWPLLYLTGEPDRLPRAQSVKATLVGPDAAAAADAQLSGAARHAEFRYWAGGRSAGGVLVHDGDRLLAAGAGRPDELAHLTCSDAERAAAAVTAALQALGGERATLCLPGPHPALQVLLHHDWRIEDYDLAMSTPDLQLPTTWAYSPGLA